MVIIRRVIKKRVSFLTKRVIKRRGKSISVNKRVSFIARVPIKRKGRKK